MVVQIRAKVEDLQAKLDDARFSLEQTVVNAPSDGFVTQLTLRPGMMALPIGLSARNRSDPPNRWEVQGT